MAELASDQHHRQAYYRADIDGLRAIAVLLVLVFHARLTPSLSGGFIGVDVFFVISGFLITSIIRREIQAGSFSILRFYERRIRRIFPALTAVILACLIAGLIILPPQQMRDLARSAVSAIGFFSNFHFLAQMGYFQPDVDTLPLLHTWSLGIEEQFYVVAPLLVLVLLTRAPRIERPVLAGIAIVSLVYAVWLVSRDRDTAFYIPLTRAWELLIGALLATGMAPIVSRFWREGLAAIGLALIIGSAFWLTPATLFPGATAIPACLGTAAIIYAGAGGTNNTARFLAWKPVWFIGQISYSLYLWHWPLLAFARFYQWGEPSWTARLGLLGLAFVLAVLSWHFIERPFRRAGGVASRRGIFAAAAAAIVLAAGFSTAARMSKGFQFRFPEIAALRTAKLSPVHSAMGCAQRPGPEPSALCEIAGDKPAFLVWGDSHAHAIATGFALAARKTGRRMVLSYQHKCPPLLGLKIGKTRDTINCATVNKAVIALIAQRKIPHVFLVGRWDAYARDWSKSRAPGGVRPSTFNGLGLSSRAAFAKLLPETVAAIVAAGSRVTLVAVAPEAGLDVPTAVVRMRISNAKPPLPTVARYREQQAVVMPVLENLGSAKVNIFYPHKILCTQNTCSIEDQGAPLYFDTHHLSTAGAQKLTPGLIKILSEDPSSK
jgi:peptidoglycan/LPS O-acetylase OafA/YrhL